MFGQHYVGRVLKSASGRTLARVLLKRRMAGSSPPASPQVAGAAGASLGQGLVGGGTSIGRAVAKADFRVARSW
jgi:hypothetical protein